MGIWHRRTPSTALGAVSLLCEFAEIENQWRQPVFARLLKLTPPVGWGTAGPYTDWEASDLATLFLCATISSRRGLASQLAGAIRYEMDRNRETIAPVVRMEVRMFNPDIGAATRWRKGSSGNPDGRPRTRLLSEALRTRLGEVKRDDPSGRTYAEVVAANLIEIACTEGPGAVAAINELLQISDYDAAYKAKRMAELAKLPRFH